MVLTEFDEEKFLKMIRAEERAEGIMEGRLEALFSILNDLGDIPPDIIENAKHLDIDTFKYWCRLAAKSNSMQEFLDKLK